MFKVELIEKEDINQWDAFVNEHSYGYVYHLSSWREVLEKSYKHIKGYFVALIDEESNEIQAGMPLYLVNSWLTGRRLVSIPFASAVDPLVSSQSEFDKISEKVFELQYKLRARFSEIRTTFFEVQNNKGIFRELNRFDHSYLLLDKTEQELLLSFNKKSVRRIINLAPKKPIELKLACDAKDLREFYHLFCLTRKRLGLPPIPYRFFKFQWDVLYPKKYLSVLLCRYNKKTIAALMILKFKDVISLEYSGENIEYRNLYPIHFLYWQAIKIGCREGYAKISFGRTSKQNSGLKKFKDNWGTQSICQADLYQSYSILKNFREDESALRYIVIKRFTKNVPMVMAKMLGRFFYRHMG